MQLRRGYDIPAVVTTSLAVNATLWAVFGVLYGGDSFDYLDRASAIAQGHVATTGAHASALGYPMLLALTTSIGIGTAGVIALQVVAAAAAAAALYDLGRRVGGRGSGIVAALLFALNLDIARWHVYLLTESLYASLLVGTVWALARASRQHSVGAFMLPVVLAVLAALLRPLPGWLVVVFCGIVAARRSLRSRRTRFAAAAGVVGVVGLVWLLPPFRASVAGHEVAEVIRRGQVVRYYEGWRQQMPATASGGLAQYVARHPLPVLSLAVLHVGAEFAHVRPFYSVRHNVLIVGVLLFVYVAAVAAALRDRHSPEIRLAMIIIGLHVVTWAATWADWDGRFLIHVLPLIGVLAAAGVRRLLPARSVRP